MLPLLPYEIVESIAFYTAEDDLAAPTLRAVFLTCHAVYDLLLGTPEAPNYALLTRLFSSRFDTAAPRRRLARGQPFPSDIFAAEFQKRCRLLRRIRSRELHVDYLIEDLWCVLLMLMEDDGKNMFQLERAGVDDWVKGILDVTAQALDEDGWPVESAVAQLAAAILTIIGDRTSVMNETPEARQAILSTLHHFLVAPHRYPITHLPVTTFHSDRFRPLNQAQAHTLLTLASMPVYDPTIMTHFGRRLTLSAPLVSESAICAIVIRNERVETYYSRDIPLNRVDADAIAWPWGMTQTDWIESNLQRSQGLGVEVPRAGGEDQNLALLENPKLGSERWDGDFWRMVHAARTQDPDPMIDSQLSRSWVGTLYVPGMFTGRWVGRLIMPSWRAHTRMLAMHPAPLSIVNQALEDEDLDQVYQPMQMNLREHIATDLLQHVCTGEALRGDGVQNAWFPADLDLSQNKGMRETGTELVVRDPREPVNAWATKRYKTWYPGMEVPGMEAPPVFPLVAPPRFPDPQAPADVNEGVPADVEMDFSEAFASAGPHPTARGEDLIEYDDDEDMDEPSFDVIITGETDYPHGKALGAYKVYGRVRRSDGLVVFVRAPLSDNGRGRWIFRGYFRAGSAIVGRWRESAADLNAAAYEGPFVLCKVGQTWGPYGV